MMPQNGPEDQLLRQHERPAAPELVERLEDAGLRCLACAHRCRIPAGHEGICRVRRNVDGELRVPWGYVAGLALDPIEKKPFFHVHPGEQALSFGMLGCNLHCPYCQNWTTSQVLRDERATAGLQEIRPESLVALAEREGSRVLVSTYNEPLITAEWARGVFEIGAERGMRCGFVSNGHATPEVLRWLRPVVEVYKVDLKSFEDRRYRELGGVLAKVLESLEQIVALGYWLEVVTLVVPGFNDTDEELGKIAGFLRGLSPDIPWHVTAFHPDYRMDLTPATPASTLERAWAIGKSAGLRHVYTGNRPGQTGDHESTRCADCDTLLIERRGFRVGAVRLDDGRCPDCGATVAGVWAPG